MADITINLLSSKNSVPTVNDISLQLNQNQFYIVAGEENATTFEISYDSKFSGYDFFVEMVNSKGYGIPKAQIIDNEFILPAGMAVAGYGQISITAEKNDEKVVFMPIKVPVQNTIPDWKEEIPTDIVVDDTTTNIIYTLRDNEQKSYLAEGVTNVQITIPASSKQGFICEVDFKTGTTIPTLSFINNTNKPFKIARYGITMDSYSLSTNKEVNFLFRDNGISVICAVLEIDR